MQSEVQRWCEQFSSGAKKNFACVRKSHPFEKFMNTSLFVILYVIWQSDGNDLGLPVFCLQHTWCSATIVRSPFIYTGFYCFLRGCSQKILSESRVGTSLKKQDLNTWFFFLVDSVADTVVSYFFLKTFFLLGREHCCLLFSF